MHNFQKIHDDLRKAANFGKKKSKNGVQLYGHMSWKGPDAWFHEIFPPLADYEIKLLQGDLMIELPEDISDFFSLTNGLTLFNGGFAIYGRRTEASFDPDVRQPYDIVPVNRFERPNDMDDHMLIVGGYRWGKGGYVVIDTRNMNVIACMRSNAKVLFRWETFAEMLGSEVTRISQQFDETGRKRNRAESELPWQ